MGRLLRKLAVGVAAHDDSLFGKLPAHLVPRGDAFRRTPAHSPAGAMARAAETLSHRAFGSDEHPRRRPHAPRDEHRLAYAAIDLRYLGIIGTECAGRSFAVHAELLAAVFLHFGDVVGDVVDEPQTPGVAERALEHSADGMGNRLAVRPCEVRRRAHRTKIRTPLRRIERRTGQLAIRQLDPVLRHDSIHLAHVVGAHLVSQSPRAGVDEHRDTAGLQAKYLGCSGVEHLLHSLDLHEVIPRAQGAQLSGTALAGPLRHLRGIRLRQAPA